MSTRIGTLQPKRTMPVVPLVILALLVAATVVVVVTTGDRFTPRSEGAIGSAAEAPNVSGGLVRPKFGSTAANTPSELRGGIVGGIVQGTVGSTAANTPTELRGGIVGGIVQGTVSSTAANTPTELSGGIAFSFAGSPGPSAAELRGKQLGIDVGGAGDPGGGLCAICWKFR